MRSPRLTVAALLLAVVATVAACGGGPAGTGADSAVGYAQGDALSFSATTLTDKPLDTAALEGRPVVLWFWAPWCTVCRAEAPGVAAIADEFRGEATFVGVPGLGEVADMRTFVDQTGLGGFEHAVDSDGSLWARFGVVSQPSFAFIAADGSVETFTGSMEADTLRQTVRDLVDK